MRLILISLLATIIGCSSFTNVYSPYSIHIQNAGEKRLDSVEIESQKGFWFDTGILSKGIIAGIRSPQPSPPNDVFTLILKREDGTEAKANLDLRNKVEKKFHGTILIKIDDRNKIIYELQSD